MKWSKKRKSFPQDILTVANTALDGSMYGENKVCAELSLNKALVITSHDSFQQLVPELTQLILTNYPDMYFSVNC